MVVLANNLYISLTIQRNSTAVTTFEHLNIWYEWSTRGTNSQWYEKSRHPNNELDEDVSSKRKR